jgi:DNA-binding CsgD family transcriptional regulator
MNRTRLRAVAAGARMRTRNADELIGLIYDAALDTSVWLAAVGKLASFLDCGQASFEFHDLASGTRIALAPLTSPEFIKSYREYYGEKFNLMGRTRTFPVGQVFRTSDFTDPALIRRTEFYNDWWRPQGVDGGSLVINLALTPQTTVLATVTKHFGYEFTKDDERAFARIGSHWRRAVEIHSRLMLTKALESNGDTCEGTLLVDHSCRILSGTTEAIREVERAGLLSGTDAGRMMTSRGELEALVRGAAGPQHGSPRAGDCHFLDIHGQPIDITVVPVRAQHWLDVAKPAAMLQVSRPGLRRKAQIERLMSEHGLTRAEAAVALEIAKGDGRAAAGVRLGIREATVRAHLSAIFEKLDIHRQAELGRFISQRTPPDPKLS